MKSKILGTLLLVVLAAQGAANASSLVGTYSGTWSFDDGLGMGTETFVITTDVASGAGFTVSGYNDDVCNAASTGFACNGREEWNGTVSAAGAVTLTDYAVVADGNGAVLNDDPSNYTGTVSDNGRTLSGTWLTQAGPAGPAYAYTSGSWSVSAVPEPATLSLLAIGLAAVGFMRVRRSKRS